MSFYITIFSLALLIRLTYIFLFNYLFDFLNIIILSTSVLRTGNLFQGVEKIIQDSNHITQLFGKVYYQLLSIWLFILDRIGIIDKDYFLRNSYPYHYQLLSIKIIQLFFELLFVIFIVLLIKENLIFFKKRLRIIIFALLLNPFFIFSPYGMFQSDLLMITFLIVSLYFFSAYKNKKNNFYLPFASLFLSISILIKQLPLLFIPLFLKFINKRLNNTIFLLSFLSFYLVFSQPFSLDYLLQKKLFLTSPESMALFDFRLNNISIFLLLFLAVIIKVFISKGEFNFLKLTINITLIICLVYLFSNNSKLFFQFSSWIFPFLILITSRDSSFTIFLLIPFISFLKFALENYAVLTPSFVASLGAPLNFSISLEEIANQYLNIDLLRIMINSLWGFILIWLAFKILNFNIPKKLNTSFSIEKITIFLLITFLLINFFDLNYRKKFTKLTMYDYQEAVSKKYLRNDPISIKINNPQSIKLTGLEMELFFEKEREDSFIEILAFDDAGRTIFEKKLPEISFFDNKNSLIKIFFPRMTDNKKIFITIKVNNKLSNVYYYSYNRKSQTNLGYLDIYDNFYKKSYLKLSSENNIKVNLIGDYSWRLMFENIKENLKIKPKFYVLYFLIYFLTLFFLVMVNFKNLNLFIFENFLRITKKLGIDKKV